MGQLDDAIREHLELKRRRGADSTEVARQEREAFGPPGRGDIEVAPATSEHGVHDDVVAAEPATLLHDGPPPLHVVATEHPEHPLQTEPPRPHGDPADALPHAEPVAGHPPAVEEHPVVEHRVEPPAEPSQPTREFDAGELRAATRPAPHEGAPAAPVPSAAPPPDPEPAAAGAARPAEDEAADPEADVLEETPEFLQETPEHDRLWFEQRPPRDFDF